MRDTGKETTASLVGAGQRESKVTPGLWVGRLGGWWCCWPRRGGKDKVVLYACGGVHSNMEFSVGRGDFEGTMGHSQGGC